MCRQLLKRYLFFLPRYSLTHYSPVFNTMEYSLCWPTLAACGLLWTALFPWALLLDNARRITAPLLPGVEH